MAQSSLGSLIESADGLTPVNEHGNTGGKGKKESAGGGFGCLVFHM